MPKLTRIQLQSYAQYCRVMLDKAVAREMFSTWLAKGSEGNAWFVKEYKRMSLKKNGGPQYAETIRGYLTMEKNDYLGMLAYNDELLARHPDVLPGIQEFLPEKSQQRPTR